MVHQADIWSDIDPWMKILSACIINLSCSFKMVEEDSGLFRYRML